MNKKYNEAEKHEIITRYNICLITKKPPVRGGFLVETEGLEPSTSAM